MNKMFGFFKSFGRSWQSHCVRAGIRAHAQIRLTGLPLMDESITNFGSIKYGRLASVVIFFFFYHRRVDKIFTEAIRNYHYGFIAVPKKTTEFQAGL